MSTNGKLRTQYGPADVTTFKATGAIGSNLLVTFDTTDDGEGGSCKVVGALSDRPVGVLDGDAAALNDKVAVVFRGGAIVPIVCADSSIACGTAVYNTAAGKISSTQGSGARLVGYTMSAIAAANELVSVLLSGPQV
jgi:Uncharacterized conserved protein (DUF2190)